VPDIAARLPSGLGEHLASIALQACPSDPPVDLDAIARALKVAQVVGADMVEDGNTTWTGDGPVIRLRVDRSAKRTRFTFAHELAHVLIAENPRVARRTRSLQPEIEELLCDWVAAAILMPHSWMQRFAQRDRFSLSLIRLISHRADVSLSAAAVRLAEVSKRLCMLLRWRRAREDQWVLAGMAGAPPALVGGLALTDPSVEDINHAWSRDSWLELGLEGSGQRVEGLAHVDRGRSTCLTLFVSLQEAAGAESAPPTSQPLHSGGACHRSCHQWSPTGAHWVDATRPDGIAAELRRTPASSTTPDGRLSSGS
jgi:hypothetical protein